MTNPQPSPCPRPLPRNLPGFDIEPAVERMMDNAALWWKALSIFHARFADWDITWQKAQLAQESERKSVHALRSVALNIGAVRLAEAAGALEYALVANDHRTTSLTSLRTDLFDCYKEARGSAAVALTEELTQENPETKAP